MWLISAEPGFVWDGNPPELARKKLNVSGGMQ